MRPTHIEDYLVTVRKGQWFGWSDSKNKIYSNLVVHDGGAKPTEKECTDGLAAQQAAWDLENDSYKSKSEIHGKQWWYNSYLEPIKFIH